MPSVGCKRNSASQVQVNDDTAATSLLIQVYFNDSVHFGHTIPWMQGDSGTVK